MPAFTELLLDADDKVRIGVCFVRVFYLLSEKV